MYIYYVYAYLRKKDLTPYYFGKGSGRRAFVQHHKNGKGISTPKDTSLIVFLETNLSDIGALALERRMILWYGRKDLGTGILRNRTDGGDGGSGFKRSKPMSMETRKLIGSYHKNKIETTETKLKKSLSHTGKKHSNETLKKLSDNSGRAITISFNGKIYRRMKDAAKEIFPNLPLYTAIRRLKKLNIGASGGN